MKQRAVASKMSPLLQMIQPVRRVWQSGRESSVRKALCAWLLLNFVCLNGDFYTLPAEWLQRLLVGSIEIFFFSSFLKRLRPTLWQNDRYLILLSLVAMLSLLGFRLAVMAMGASALAIPLSALSVAPLIAGSLLVGTLVSPSVAIIGGAVLIFGITWVSSLPLPVLLMGLVGSWSGVLVMTPLRDRQHLVRGGALLSLMMAGLSSSFVLDGGDETLRSALNAALWGAIGGVGATALFWLGTALVERPFRLDTPLMLLELSSPDYPLLKRLREEAPGTHAHSTNVGLLAEAGAQAIGADSLLARVGGYYHDIGKLKRPSFFIENQSGYNAHYRLTPNLSAVIIAAHVRDGVELARAHRLPTRVCEIIAQHHGTCLITYFYHQALANGEHDPVLEQHFRYEGPKPRSKEAALVMLADTVEAAARCLESPSPARLGSLVHDLIEMRRADGQLDESELTFRDLARIEEAFVKALSAIHHQRLDYAEVKVDEYVLQETS